MKVIDLEDGWQRLLFSPEQGVPMIDDWLKVLESRGFAIHTKTIKNAKGDPIKVLKALDRFSAQPVAVTEDGKVAQRCIGCGNAIIGEMLDNGHRKGYARKVFNATDQIRIGGWIQMPYEQANWQSKEIRRSWRRVPVTMTGLGCAECRERFRMALISTNAANEARKMYGAFLLQSASNETQRQASPIEDVKKAMQDKCLHGLVKMFCAVCRRGKPADFKATIKVKLPAEQVAFIDVFYRDAMEP